MITKVQADKIKLIVKKHMEVLTKILVGEGNPSPALIKKLGLPKELSDLITDSYKYGKLRVLQGKDLSKMSEAEVNKLIDKITLTPNQAHSLDYLKMKTQLSIDSLETRILANTMSKALQEQLNMYQAVQKVVPKAMKEHQEFYKVVQELRETSGDWERDWHRVAMTEMVDTKNMGEANAILDGESPFSTDKGDTIVFKRPRADCCLQCKKHYLEADGITPKTFKLSELMANGNNYGKKTADWKPTVGTLHPNCQCVLGILPDGYGFDSTGQLTPLQK
jgi:hypothetical protein